MVPTLAIFASEDQRERERSRGRMALISCMLESVASSRHSDRLLSQKPANESIPSPGQWEASTAAKYSTKTRGEYQRGGDLGCFLGGTPRLTLVWEKVQQALKGKLRLCRCLGPSYGIIFRPGSSLEGTAIKDNSYPGRAQHFSSLS
jgi:hypothetical protein